MAEHPNAALIRSGYEAFAAGDLGAVRELRSPEMGWHTSGSGALAGDEIVGGAFLADFG